MYMHPRVKSKKRSEKTPARPMLSGQTRDVPMKDIAVESKGAGRIPKCKAIAGRRIRPQAKLGKL